MFFEALKIAVSNAPLWSHQVEDMPQGKGCNILECELSNTRLIISADGKTPHGSGNLVVGRSPIETLFRAWMCSGNEQILPATINLPDGARGPLRFLGWAKNDDYLTENHLVAVDANFKIHVWSL